jgi:hypothetical protein
MFPSAYSLYQKTKDFETDTSGNIFAKRYIVSEMFGSGVKCTYLRLYFSAMAIAL